jgi:hypothetical protein
MVSRKRGIPIHVTTETQTVAKTTLRFLCEDPDSELPTQLTVHLDAQGITVHDEWDKSETDYTVHWLDLRRTARAHEWMNEERSELALTRQTLNALIDEARCVVTGKLGPRCGPPECTRPFAILGPIERGMRERCDTHAIPVRQWPKSADGPNALD